MRREGGVVSILNELEIPVRTLDLWDDPARLIRDGERQDARPRALILEALDRPDLAVAALDAVRRVSHFDDVGTLIAVTDRQIASLSPDSGFDDFVRYPYVAEELEGRLLAIEWRRAAMPAAARRNLGRLVVDRSGHDVYVDGRPIRLTPREFSLVAYFCDRRGMALTRERLLQGIWGDDYAGDPQTVDGSWFGFGLQPVLKVDGFSAGLRFEYFSDNDGTRTGAPGTDINVWNLTLTPGYTVEGWMIRAEYRFDSANEPIFNGGSGDTEDQQHTIAAAVSYMF